DARDVKLRSDELRLTAQARPNGAAFSAACTLLHSHSSQMTPDNPPRMPLALAAERAGEPQHFGGKSLANQCFFLHDPTARSFRCLRPAFGVPPFSAAPQKFELTKLKGVSKQRVVRASLHRSRFIFRISEPSQTAPVIVTGSQSTSLRGRCSTIYAAQPELATQRSSSHSQERNMIDRAVQLLTEIWGPYMNTPAALSQTSSLGTGRAEQPPSDATLMPIRAFVYHILRRSRTKSCVLQSALCYIEGVRGKLPELATREVERINRGGHPAKALRPQVTIANMSPLDMTSLSLGSYTPSLAGPAAPPVLRSEPHPLRKSTSVGDIPSPSATAPSPLLCPRRTFLAALVLAHKFIMEKCYSNRAWAKIAGLPPREVGRCERALGEALDWRLWVGKGSATVEAAAEAESDKAVAAPRRADARASSGPAPESCSLGFGLGSHAYLDASPHAPFLSGPAPSPGTPGLSTSPSSQASSASPASEASPFEPSLAHAYASNHSLATRKAHPWPAMTQDLLPRVASYADATYEALAPEGKHTSLFTWSHVPNVTGFAAVPTNTRAPI
ncbi:hypothetical protein HDZ31DRAFT_76216, partial [Schizophyllum fasciatum]